MRGIESIFDDVAEIYRESGNDAEEYLHKARKLKEKFGPGLAVVYCWFYSVPQKWTQVEPKIFELMRSTNSFDLNTVLAVPKEKLAKMLKPMIFSNKISGQFKNFCCAVRKEYVSWNNFVEELGKEDIFAIFGKLRTHKNCRTSFKNLAAMMIFIGMSDDLLILDTHVAKAIGMNKNEVSKYRAQERLFRGLLSSLGNVTEELKRRGFNNITMAKWSLAIWFNKANIQAKQLLTL